MPSRIATPSLTCGTFAALLVLIAAREAWAQYVDVPHSTPKLEPDSARSVLRLSYDEPVAYDSVPLPTAVKFGGHDLSADDVQSQTVASPSGLAPVADPTIGPIHSAHDSDPAALANAIGLPSATFWQRSIYGRIDYFVWREWIDAGDLVHENGPLFTLGYEQRFNRVRLRGELFGSQVQHEAYYMDSHTRYFGLRGECDVLFNPDFAPSWTYVVGIGNRLWFRDVLDESPSGGFNLGYSQTWWTVYPYAGVETRIKQTRLWQFYFSGRLGLTAFTIDSAQFHSFYDSTIHTVQNPLPGLVTQLEIGMRKENFFIGVYEESMTWGSESGAYSQPNTSFGTIGLKAAWSL